MKLSLDKKILAVLLILFVVCGVLLTPLGFETRATEVLGNAASLPWLALAFAGLILVIVSFVLLLLARTRVASILALIGSISSVILFIADQTGIVVSIQPPALVTAVEAVASALVTGIVLFAIRVYRARD